MHPLADQRIQQLEGPDLTERDLQAVTRLGARYRVLDGDVRRFRVEVAKTMSEGHGRHIFKAHHELTSPPFCPPGSVRLRLSIEMRPMGFWPDQGK